MKNLSTICDIFEGKINLIWREQFAKSVQNLPDGRYILHLEKVYNKRSLDQNNAMWGIPYMFFAKAIHDNGILANPSKDQVHNFCMYHCLPEDYKERIKTEWEQEKGFIDLKTGEEVKEPFHLTTRKMTTSDAMNYYANMQQFYAEWFASGREDDFIPDPDQSKKKHR